MHIQLTKIMTPFLEVTSQQFSSLLTRRSTIVLFLVSKLRARQKKHLTSSKNTCNLMLGDPIGHWPRIYDAIHLSRAFPLLEMCETIV